MTQGGVLFELQMPGHLMGGQEFSSLPTPKATNNENQQNLENYGPNLGMVLMPNHYNWPMLPTPLAQMGGPGKFSPNLRTLIKSGKTATMLPTPTARDYRDFQIEAAKHRPEATDTLNRALAHHFGVNTNRPLPDGSPSPDRRHNQLFTEPTVNDSTPDSLSG
jgi:hypothetical protein